VHFVAEKSIYVLLWLAGKSNSVTRFFRELRPIFMNGDIKQCRSYHTKHHLNAINYYYFFPQFNVLTINFFYRRYFTSMRQVMRRRPVYTRRRKQWQLTTERFRVQGGRQRAVPDNTRGLSHWLD